MKKTLIAVSLLAASVGAFAQSGLKPLGYPGSNWSVLTLSPGVIKNSAEEHNILLQGKIEQGIDWKKFGADKNWTLNTYFSLGYSADKNALVYNNKLVPAVGVKMTRSFDSGVVDFGVQVAHERYFRGNSAGARNSGTGVQAYASYWFGWNLGK